MRRTTVRANRNSYLRIFAITAGVFVLLLTLMSLYLFTTLRNKKSDIIVEKPRTNDVIRPTEKYIEKNVTRKPTQKLTTQKLTTQKLTTQTPTTTVKATKKLYDDLEMLLKKTDEFIAKHSFPPRKVKKKVNAELSKHEERVLLHNDFFKHRKGNVPPAPTHKLHKNYVIGEEQLAHPEMDKQTVPKKNASGKKPRNIKESNTIPLFIYDQHQDALQAWMLAKKRFGRKVPLIHFDPFSDGQIADREYSFLHMMANPHRFITKALRMGFVSSSNMVWIKPEWLQHTYDDESHERHDEWRHVFSNETEALHYFEHKQHSKPRAVKVGKPKPMYILDIDEKIFAMNDPVLTTHVLDVPHVVMWFDLMEKILNEKKFCWKNANSKKQLSVLLHDIIDKNVIFLPYSTIKEPINAQRTQYDTKILENWCGGEKEGYDTLVLYTQLIHEIMMEDPMTTNALFVLSTLYEFPSLECETPGPLFGTCGGTRYLPSTEEVRAHVKQVGNIIENIGYKPCTITISKSVDHVPSRYQMLLDQILIPTLRGSIPLPLEVQYKSVYNTTEVDSSRIDLDGLLSHIRLVTEQTIYDDMNTRTNIALGMSITKQFITEHSGDASVLEEDTLKDWMRKTSKEMECGIKFSELEWKSGKWVEKNIFEINGEDNCIAHVKWSVKFMREVLSYSES